MPQLTLTARPARYLVEFPRRCVVGYSCSLGAKQSKDWATETASLYRGSLYLERADGQTELVHDYRYGRPVNAEPVLTTPLGQLAQRSHR